MRILVWSSNWNEKNITKNFFEQIIRKKNLILKSNIEIDDYDDS